MGSTWKQVGQAADLVQLTGLNAVALIGLIAKAANTARMHKKNCKQFAQHLKLIGNLLEQLKISELKRERETREPLEMLENELRRAYMLVNSCREKSYLYMVAMGWNIVHQFRRAQEEIDRYLQIIPLITLLDNARVRERLSDIQKDQREYTFDDSDQKVQLSILSTEPSKAHAGVLKKSLSCSYPDLPFEEALKKEKDKLKLELQKSQHNMDFNQCEVIRHLIEVTESTTNLPPPKSQPFKNCSEANFDKGYSKGEREFSKTDTQIKSVSSSGGSDQNEEWHSDLLGCCSEPCLCIKTCFCPCGTFSKVASAATGRNMTSAEACNDLVSYSLVLACCCYTCCIRRKLRKRFMIKGGVLDDFLSHVMCCCCALVQEWREVEIRGVAFDPEKTKTSPPPSPCMES